MSTPHAGAGGRRTVVGRLADLSLGAKLGSSFGVLVVGLVAAVIVGISGMNSMSGGYDHVVKVGEARQATVLTAEVFSVSMHYSETKYVLLGAAGRADFLGDRQAFGAALDHLVALSGPSEKSSITAIQAAVARFDRGETSLWALFRAGRTAQAISLVKGAQRLAGAGLMDALVAYQNKATPELARETTRFNSTASSSKLTMILVGVLAVLIGLTAGLLMTRSIAIRARKMVRAANAIADGDVDQHIDLSSNDELGEMAAAFTRMVDYLKTMVSAAQRIADGDLSVDIEPASDRDALGCSFSLMVENLRELASNLSFAADRVSVASHEMASTSEEAGKASSEIAHAVGDVAQGAERQVRMVDAAKDAAANVARAVTESADSANHAAEMAHETRKVAQEGMGAAGEANRAMQSVRESSQAASEAIRQLAGKSDKIGAIVATITGIAEQTNLLALNAAIEAARAGEQGRGFAVVAEEVRKLAEDSQKAAQEISVLIGAIQGDTTTAVGVVETGAKLTQDGAAVVEKTREAFERIESSVDDITARIEQIASASQEIAASAESMQDSIGEIAAVAQESSSSTEEVSASTEQTTASAEQISASAHQLSGNAEELKKLVAQFTLAS
jgi:methyl-accepting chemotaxis protein